MKAKFTAKTIQMLAQQNGENIMDRKEIMQQVQGYYTQLYRKDPITEEGLQARQEAFTNISKKVTAQQDQTVHEKPSEAEIDKIVSILGTDKSPGLDGVTLEALLFFWEFIRRDCQDMIFHFWETGELLQGPRTVVIKLIPKNRQKEFLKNWRPLSLMPLTYKIVTKIMAERIKCFLPQLVDSQQVGFVQGRDISANLLSLRIGKDWAAATQQRCIFLKLDFVKAYDSIDQDFLLQTLQAMGFTMESIRLIKGLTCKGKANIHVNQDFHAKIDVQRGVRQGCPLAPYLFRFCTQILMDQLRVAKTEGTVRGLTIDGETALLHQLFADDKGIFLQEEETVFQKTMDILANQQGEAAWRLKVTHWRELIYKEDNDDKTFDHAMWTCPVLRGRTTWAGWLLLNEDQRHFNNQGTEPLIHIIDEALRNHKLQQAHILLILAILRCNWMERNTSQFRDKQISRGNTPLLNEIEMETKALQPAARSNKRKNEIQRTLHTIAYWRGETTRWMAGAERRNEQPLFNPNVIPNTNDPEDEDTTATDRQCSLEDMIRWDHEETTETRQASTTNALSRRGRQRRRRTTPDTTLNAQQREEIRSHLRHLIDTWHTSEEVPIGWDEGNNLMTFQSEEKLLEEILGTPTVDQEVAPRGTPTL
ncbi:hypothetical protein R1sor_005417 [Riccia sorocarpa]|uniref:Reverse transcriptase domain-containing protein n=1 Tax=Riccia sorocarpa TaxID=122646 RepID=A0ABD3HNR8_9MARC